jgi:hypothetical protein
MENNDIAIKILRLLIVIQWFCRYQNYLPQQVCIVVAARNWNI